MAFIYYSIGIFPMAVAVLITQAFYSLKNTKYPMIIGVFSVIINIILNLLLINPMKHNGLAFATSITSFITVVPLIILLRKEIGPFNLRNSLITLLKVTLASMVMGGLIYFAYGVISSII